MESPPEKREAIREPDLSLSQRAAGKTEAHEIRELLQADLLATVSHELRSPLTAIKGYAATLLLHEHRITLEERREFLLTIKESCERLESLIARMLELSQLEAGNVVMQQCPVNLVYLICETILAQEHFPVRPPGEGEAEFARNHSLFTLHLEDVDGSPTNEEPLIQGDRRLLGTMFSHLFENARHAAPEGAPIDVTLRPFRMHGQSFAEHALSPGMILEKEHLDSGPVENLPMIEICIRDQGKGIPPEHLERIFERFYRVDTQLTREGGGLGLGLALCKHIVALHHGRIWAESEVEKGSIFHVLLPVNGPAQ